MKKAFLQLHASILLAGFTGVLGRLISMNEVDIVFYRILVALLILIVFVGIPRVGWRKFFQIAGCGALLAIHWILFYSSIKMSNVSIGVVCYALVGFYTALLEPWIYHRKVKFSEVGFSLITLLGILLIFSFDPRYRGGILMGTVSSFVAALFMVLAKKVSTDVKSRDMMVYEMASVSISALRSFSSVLPCRRFLPSSQGRDLKSVDVCCIKLIKNTRTYYKKHGRKIHRQ